MIKITEHKDCLELQAKHTRLQLHCGPWPSGVTPTEALFCQLCLKKYMLVILVTQCCGQSAQPDAAATHDACKLASCCCSVIKACMMIVLHDQLYLLYMHAYSL